MSPINILVTADAGYMVPVRTLLRSLFIHNRAVAFHIYLMHADIPDALLNPLASFCSRHGGLLLPVRVPRGLFATAPVRSYYTEAMYYRLLAHHFLPDHVERILYLDPDTLVINPVTRLYATELGPNLFAAASHSGLTNIVRIVNAIRLGTRGTKAYFNSGVLLCNVPALRAAASPDAIFECVAKNRNKLILPDQDVLNILFGDRILLLDERLFNYDARRYELYYLASGGTVNMAWVLRNTVILHYCGRAKPWRDAAGGRFAALYKEYMADAALPASLARRTSPGKTRAFDLEAGPPGA
ncbi:MAG: glycosyltransferase family 8 protein [Deltaproteobacteria bacterium]|nr:glycosyltransferase family 8 protein [Deltaproteobacteria bacterium]